MAQRHRTHLPVPGGDLSGHYRLPVAGVPETAPARDGRRLLLFPGCEEHGAPGMADLRWNPRNEWNPATLGLDRLRRGPHVRWKNGVAAQLARPMRPSEPPHRDHHAT